MGRKEEVVMKYKYLVVLGVLLGALVSPLSAQNAGSGVAAPGTDSTGGTYSGPGSTGSTMTGPSQTKAFQPPDKIDSLGGTTGTVVPDDSAVVPGGTSSTQGQDLNVPRDQDLNVPNGTTVNPEVTPGSPQVPGKIIVPP